MPTNEELQQTFESLVGSGLGFLERSASELKADPSISVVHFATGLELLLKARLYREHWALVCLKPHEARWAGLLSGDGRTIAAKSLCKAIGAATDSNLTPEAEAFGQVFKHRNKVVHFLPPEELEDVVAEQCRAWYRLHRLLLTGWKNEFGAFSKRIEQIDRALLSHRAYLQARYDGLSDELSALPPDQLADCPSCGFKAAVLESPDAAFSRITCRVCHHTQDLAKFECGTWQELEAATECECGESHTLDELMELVAPTPPMRAKEMLLYEPDRYHCGECLLPEVSVVQITDDEHKSEHYACLRCSVRYDYRDLSECQWCSARWAGYDTEHSYLVGCEWCDGRPVKD